MTGLLNSLNKKKELTPKQQSFLDNLVTTGGDSRKSAELAGYAGNHYQVLKALKDEVLDLTTNVLAQAAPQAAFKLLDIMNADAPIPQATNKLQAAQTILDRVGIAKTEKLDINHKVAGGIFIMPEKEVVIIDVENSKSESELLQDDLEPIKMDYSGAFESDIE
jgi:phage terminase small subunit